MHEREREHGQRFLIDLALVPRSALGCETDRLGDTVSYGDAARLAVEIATNTRFDLIERLAAHIADGLLARMPLERATVTVHKPDAPLGTRLRRRRSDRQPRSRAPRYAAPEPDSRQVRPVGGLSPYRGARPTTTMG